MKYMKKYFNILFNEIKEKGLKSISIDDGFISIVLLDGSKKYFGTNDEKILKEFIKLKNELEKR